MMMRMAPEIIPTPLIVRACRAFRLACSVSPDTTRQPDNTESMEENYYRPQMKFAKVMGYVFTPVCHSVHRGGVCLSACWDTPLPNQTHPPEQTLPGDDPPGRHPLAQCMLGDTGNKRAVCILLECILVFR